MASCACKFFYVKHKVSSIRVAYTSNNLFRTQRHKASKEGKLTTLSGRDVVTAFPISDAAKSSSGGGFSLNTSLPFVASSGSSGSLRLFGPEKKQNKQLLKIHREIQMKGRVNVLRKTCIPQVKISQPAYKLMCCVSHK